MCTTRCHQGVVDAMALYDTPELNQVPRARQAADRKFTIRYGMGVVDGAILYNTLN